MLNVLHQTGCICLTSPVDVDSQSKQDHRARYKTATKGRHRQGPYRGINVYYVQIYYVSICISTSLSPVMPSRLPTQTGKCHSCKLLIQNVISLRYVLASTIREKLAICFYGVSWSNVHVSAEMGDNRFFPGSVRHILQSRVINWRRKATFYSIEMESHSVYCQIRIPPNDKWLVDAFKMMCRSGEGKAVIW